MKFLLIHTFYETYMQEFYQRRRELPSAPYSAQIETLIKDGFGAAHTYSPYMEKLGYQAELIIANCPYTQAKWLQENGKKLDTTERWVEDIVRMQIEAYRPDVLFMGNPILFDSSFIRTLTTRPPLVAGWRAASIPATTDWSSYDLIVSSSTVCLKAALAHGAKAAERFSPGFPTFIASEVEKEAKRYDVVFTGGWSGEHGKRNELLHEIARAAGNPLYRFEPALFLAGAAEQMPPEVARINRGALWGMEMYRALRQGQIVFNAHIDMAGGESSNMRMFETTGVGSFLLTDYTDNLVNYFKPGVEIETYRSKGEMLEKIQYYLEHPMERELIASRGRKRCFQDHSMEKRIVELDAIIRKHLSPAGSSLSPHSTSTLSTPSQQGAAPPAAEDVYDTAYRLGWQDPALKELVYLCYKTPDLADNARRFYQSEEFGAALGVLAALGKAPGKETALLDLGCGNGVASYALSRAGYAVTGIDSSTGEIAGINAARKIQGLDGTGFEIVQATGASIPFPDNSFEVVWMREVLHHMKDLPSFLREMKRILKPGGVICCLRDVVIWNESQREQFFATHPFYPITRDEGCFYLQEYLDGFAQAGLRLEQLLDPFATVINSYPAPFVAGRAFNAEAARSRMAGYDLFSFFASKPQSAVPVQADSRQLEAVRQPAPQLPPAEVSCNRFGERFPGISFGANLQIIGLANIEIGAGSCIADNVWLNVCIRDDQVRMRIGKSVLVGRQSVVSTAGYLEIGDYCVFAPRVYVSDADHVFADITQPVMQQGTTVGRSVVIEENCWLGINTVVSGNLTIGRGSVIGANCVVTKEVPPFSVVVGNPAVIVKMFNPQSMSWEKCNTDEGMRRVMEARKALPLPSREEYRSLLSQRALFTAVDPLVAGNNISI